MAYLSKKDILNQFREVMWAICKIPKEMIVYVFK